MFLPDKKKAATIILSRMKGGQEKMAQAAPVEKSGGVTDDAYTSMAEDLLSAIESKSVPDLAEVLESVCQYMQAKDDDQDDSGE